MFEHLKVFLSNITLSYQTSVSSASSVSVILDGPRYQLTLTSVKPGQIIPASPLSSGARRVPKREAL